MFNSNPGDPLATSYASLDDFNNYWALWPLRQPGWIASAPDGEKRSALMAATIMIDESFIWTGSPNVVVAPAQPQALAWPRVGMFDINGNNIPNDPTNPLSIPLRLKQATCEFAGQAYAQDRLADDDADKFQVQLARAGDVEVRMQRASLETIESADIWARLKGPEFNWISRAVPEAVRRLLLQGWYTQPTIKRPLIFQAFGGSDGSMNSTSSSPIGFQP